MKLSNGMNRWNLTDREQEALSLLTTDGVSCSKVLAKRMSCATKTADTFVQRACEKMGVKTRIQAVLLWDREVNRHVIDYETCAHCSGLGFMRKVA